MKTRTNTGEGGRFGPGGHEGADGSRGALVYIGRPDLEGRGGYFEGESDEHQRGGRSHHDGVGGDVAVGENGLDFVQRVVWVAP